MSRRLAAVTALLTLGVATAAPAAVVEERTERVSTGPSGADRAAASRHAAIAGDGRHVAFDSDATRLVPDANGSTTDVYVRDLAGRTTALVSTAVDGTAGDGPSSHPTIAADGLTVAFVSGATNLVPADANGVDDVLVRTLSAMTRASVDDAGVEGNAASFAPDLSADGRFVAFASDATNLAPGDTNDQTDVFVRDLVAGTTTLVSRAGAESAAGASTNPAISPDGRHVSFTSDAADLVPGDRNVAADVFLADVRTGKVQRVSVDSRGREQDDATHEPYLPVSDVSAGGAYVVFDSDGTSLVRRDSNGATDVFLRDVAAGRTTRVSGAGPGTQADSDSFFPTITPNGRFVAYESFAGNLSDHDGRREDLFVLDRRTGRPALIDVPDEGGRKERERLRQLLQRPTLSADGRKAAFTSTADDLVKGRGGRQDVFVRRLAAPAARLRLDAGAYRLTADDPFAEDFSCTLDGAPFACGATGRLPALAPGRHVLRARAGGAGMLWQARPLVRRFTVR